MLTKQCRVCGDKAIGFNFNVVTCESCKTFFRRHAVKFDAPFCMKFAKCEITKQNKRNCIACRMDKCLSIGMDKNLIFSRNDRKLKYGENRQEIVRLYRNATDLKGHELNRLIEVRAAVSVFQEEDTFTLIGEAQDMIETANLQQNSVIKVIKFCKNLTAFKRLNQTDQLILFKNFFPERGLIRVAFQYDSKKDGFPVIQNVGEKRALLVPFSLMNKYQQTETENSALRKLCTSLNLAMENDFTVRDLIASLLLFKERTNVHNREHIHYHYALYNYLLRRYLENKYANVEKANRKYLALMSSLTLIDSVTVQVKSFYTNIQRTQSPDQIAQILREIYCDS